MPVAKYFNPDAAAYVTSSFDFARFNQYLSNAGDIFEAPEGCRAIGLGPDSDVSRVTCAYFDPQFPNSRMSIATITPGRAFTAPISAVPKTGQYQPSGVPGRILFWASEKYDPTFATVNSISAFELPMIDVIQYFADPSESIEGQRADKEYYYARFRPTTPGGSVALCVPYYGRRFASIQLEMSGGDAVNPVTVVISGLNFQISQTSYPLTALIAPFTMEDGEATQQLIRAAVHGLHDYLYLRFSADVAAGSIEPVLIRVRVSDQDS